MNSCLCCTIDKPGLECVLKLNPPPYFFNKVSAFVYHLHHILPKNCQLIEMLCNCRKIGKLRIEAVFSDRKQC